MKTGLACTAALVAALVSSSAQAALTSSEKGQIKDFIVAAKNENASKVRSLVARTDLTPDEAAGALTESIAPVTWSDARGAFLKELLFGGAASARPVLATSAVKAVIARADAIYTQQADRLEKDSRAVAELVALYAWMDVNVANAGTPTPTGHDTNAGLTPATYEECSKALKEHVEKNAKFLKGDGTVPEPIARVRAQAQTTLIDMMPDGLTRRVEAADRIGIKGARKQMLADWGVLVADSGKLDDAKVTKLRDTLQRMAGARVDLSLVYYGPTDRAQSLRARGEVVQAVTPSERWPFEGDAPASFDPVVSAIVHDLSVVAASHALKASAALKAQATTDASSASGDPGRVVGKPHAPSPEYVVGSAIHALMTDAPKTFELMVSRYNNSQPQTAALVSDALACLAAYAPEDKEAKAAPAAPKIDLAKAGAWSPATAIKKGIGDSTASFTFDGHPWAIDRAAADGKVVGIRKDGGAATALKPPPAAPAPATPPKKK